jgi:translation initiation factor 2-alpha kinase 4
VEEVLIDSPFGMPQVRHLDFKKEKDVEREGLIKFLSDAICSQFKNPTIWS